ncbi:MAG: nicotinate (nicotinamide) nucleotide adenylyltransferase [Planctomycetes bacterium]|nr:nicotinate (nicotinamide) nucleotide adenylyltransferase [Planctomycetota bacterium]MBI3847918.1 nicotinate (nicotinamide) nucleotide adenylyltransferase [Planctomycetota bacterium]
MHFGHLVVAEAARDALALDRVLFVPAANPPHKPKHALLPAKHRVKLLRLALRGNPAFEVCDLEIQRGGTSYTLHTLLELRRRFGSRARLHFLIGADSLLDLPEWFEARRLLGLAQFVTYPRPGFDVRLLRNRGGSLGRANVVKLLRSTLDAPEIGISATDVRRRVQSGRSIRYLVPDAVRRAIDRHGFYRSPRS